jgi:hypothetical protein
LTCCQQNFAKAEAKNFFQGPKNYSAWQACNAQCAATFADKP